MILTGKAKEDFLEYYNNHSIKYLLSWTYFDDLPLVVKNALIIEWFDSISVFIQDLGFIHNVGNVPAGFDISVSYKGRLYQDFEFQKSRQKAIEKAIKKANEIYNNL